MVATHYHVSKVDHRWITKGDGVTVGIHKTQREAIDAAKKRAMKDRATISWDDQNGKPQGKGDYS